MAATAPATANGGAATNAGAPPDLLAGAGPGTAGAAAGTAGMGAGGVGSVLPCPDVFGDYRVKNTEGACAGVNKDAPQSIESTAVTCFAHFRSVPLTGNPGVNGGTDIDENGDFTSAKLTLGLTVRTPCSGTWNPGAQQMTIKCGGPGDSCTVLLERL